MRESVYADIGAQQRAVAHARAARLLAATGCPDERVAAQIVEAEPAQDQQRVVFLRRVAGAATARGAPAAAIAWLRRALGEPPAAEVRGEVLSELGSAELRLGLPAAATHLAEAVELVREPALLARAVRQLANALIVAGDADAAVRAIESAAAAVESDRELTLLLEAEAAAHALRADRGRRAAVAARLARHAGLAGSTPAQRLVLACIANHRARDSRTAAEAAAHLERALAGGRLFAERDLDVTYPLYDLMVGLLAVDAVELAGTCLEQALAPARASGALRGCRTWPTCAAGCRCGVARSPTPRPPPPPRARWAPPTAAPSGSPPRRDCWCRSSWRPGTPPTPSAPSPMPDSTPTAPSTRSCSNPAACCGSRRAGSGTAWTTCWSSVAAARAGVGRTRWPPAGARRRLSRLPTSASTPGSPTTAAPDPRSSASSP
ncbi:MAG: hypothetical protein L0K86_28605, partial [Actinomycetia bacterium]|nr:hypothetical protein [Actinomycetes bacterium]